MSRRATTMVEILISVVIVGIFAVTFIPAVTRNAMNTKVSTDKQVIMDVLRDEADISLAEAHAGQLTVTNRTVSRAPAVDFPVSITKTVVLIALTNKLYSVKVTANWDAGAQRRGSLSLSTIAFKE